MRNCFFNIFPVKKAKIGVIVFSNYYNNNFRRSRNPEGRGNLSSPFFNESIRQSSIYYLLFNQSLLCLNCIPDSPRISIESEEIRLLL